MNLEQRVNKLAGDIVELSQLMGPRHAQTVAALVKSNAPGPKLGKAVYALTVACGQVAVNHNMFETAARFNKAGTEAVKTTGGGDPNPRAAEMARDVVAGANLAHKGARQEDYKNVQRGLFKVAHALSEVMMHYDNGRAEGLFDAAVQAARSGH